MLKEVVELANGIKMNVKYNKKDKPTILFLHFGSGNLHMWKGVIPHFKDNYQVILPDFRGHGQTSKPEKGYHIEDMAEDIELLLEELNIDNYYIVGSSLGAEVATVLASQNPKKVKAIFNEGALYNEFGKYGLQDGGEEEIEEKIQDKLEDIEKRKEESYATKEEYIETQSRFFQRASLWNEYFAHYIKNNVCQNEEGRYTSCYPNHVSKQYMKNYYRFQFDKYYKKIQCPILFLPSKSEWDNEKIKQSVKEFGKMAGSYEIKILPGFAHAYGWMKMPTQVSQVVLDFIQKH